MSSIRLGYAQLLLQCLLQSGVDVSRLYGRAEVEALARKGSDARMPVHTWDAMVDTAQAGFGAQDVALTLAGFITPMDMGPVGFIMMSCRDLGGSMAALARFFPTLCNAYALELAMVGPRLVASLQPTGASRSAHLERFMLGLMCRHARWLARHDSLSFDAQLAFPRSASSGLSPCQETFGSELRFGADVSVLWYPPGAELLEVSRDCGTIKALLEPRLTADMAALGAGGTSLLREVEQAVAAKLACGDVRIEAIAGELGVSVRTLQVRMKSVGLSFRALVDEARHRQALMLVGDGTVSLAEVATGLGFASQSSFARAFQRWTKVSPGLYRKACARPLSTDQARHEAGLDLSN